MPSPDRIHAICTVISSALSFFQRLGEMHFVLVFSCGNANSSLLQQTFFFYHCTAKNAPNQNKHLLPKTARETAKRMETAKLRVQGGHGLTVCHWNGWKYFSESRKGFVWGTPATSIAIVRSDHNPGHFSLQVSLQVTDHTIAAEREFGHHLLLCSSQLEAELLVSSFTFHLLAATV